MSKASGGVAYFQSTVTDDGVNGATAKFGTQANSLEYLFYGHTGLRANRSTKSVPNSSKLAKNDGSLTAVAHSDFHPIRPLLCSADESGVVVVWDYIEKRQLHRINLGTLLHSTTSSQHTAQTSTVSQKSSHRFTSSSISSSIDNIFHGYNTSSQSTSRGGDSVGDQIDLGSIVNVFFLDPDVIQAKCGVAPEVIPATNNPRRHIIIGFQKGIVVYNLIDRTLKVDTLDSENSVSDESKLTSNNNRRERLGSASSAGTLPGNTYSLTCIVPFSCAHVCCGCSDGTIRLWDLGTNRMTLELPRAHFAPITALVPVWGEPVSALSSSSVHSLRFCSGCVHGRLLLWEVHPVAVLQNSLVGVGHLGIPEQVDSTPKNVAKGSMNWVGIHGYGTGIASLTYDSSTRRLCATTMDRSMAIWSLGVNEVYIRVAHCSTFGTMLKQLHQHTTDVEVDNESFASPFTAVDLESEGKKHTLRPVGSFRRSAKSISGTITPPTRNSVANSYHGFQKIKFRQVDTTVSSTELDDVITEWNHASTEGKVAARLVYHVTNLPSEFTGDCIPVGTLPGIAEDSFCFLSTSGQIINAVPRSVAETLADHAWLSCTSKQINFESRNTNDDDVGCNNQQNCSSETPSTGIENGKWNENLVSLGTWNSCNDLLQVALQLNSYFDQVSNNSQHGAVRTVGMIEHPVRKGRFAILTNMGVYVVNLVQEKQHLQPVASLDNIACTEGSEMNHCNKLYLVLERGLLKVCKYKQIEDEQVTCDSYNSVTIGSINPWMWEGIAAPLELNDFRSGSRKPTNAPTPEIECAPRTLFPGPVCMEVLETTLEKQEKQSRGYFVSFQYPRLHQFVVASLSCTADESEPFGLQFTCNVIDGGHSSCLTWASGSQFSTTGIFHSSQEPILLVGIPSSDGMHMVEGISHLNLPSTANSRSGILTSLTSGGSKNTNTTKKRNSTGPPEVTMTTSPTPKIDETDNLDSTKRPPKRVFAKRRSFSSKSQSSVDEMDSRQELVASLAAIHSRVPEIEVRVYKLNNQSSEKHDAAHVHRILCESDPVGIDAHGPFLIIHFGRKAHTSVWDTAMAKDTGDVQSHVETEITKFQDLVGAGIAAEHKTQFYSWDAVQHESSTGSFTTLKQMGQSITTPTLVKWGIPTKCKDSYFANRITCGLVYQQRGALYASTGASSPNNFVHSPQIPHVHLLVCELPVVIHGARQSKLKLRKEGVYRVGDCDDSIVDLLWYRESLFVLLHNKLVFLPLGRNVAGELQDALYCASQTVSSEGYSKSSTKFTMETNSSPPAQPIAVMDRVSSTASSQELEPRRLIRRIEPIVLTTNDWLVVSSSCAQTSYSITGNSIRGRSSSAELNGSWAFTAGELSDPLTSKTQTLDYRNKFETLSNMQQGILAHPTGCWRLLGIVDGNVVLWGTGEHQGQHGDVVGGCRKCTEKFANVKLENPYVKFTILVAAGAVNAAMYWGNKCEQWRHDAMCQFLVERGYQQIAVEDDSRLEGTTLRMEINIVLKHLMLDHLCSLLHRLYAACTEPKVWHSRALQSSSLLLLLGCSHCNRIRIPAQYCKRIGTDSCREHLEQHTEWMIKNGWRDEAISSSSYLMFLGSTRSEVLLRKATALPNKNSDHDNTWFLQNALVLASLKADDPEVERLMESWEQKIGCKFSMPSGQPQGSKSKAAARVARRRQQSRKPTT